MVVLLALRGVMMNSVLDRTLAAHRLLSMPLSASQQYLYLAFPYPCLRLHFAADDTPLFV